MAREGQEYLRISYIITKEEWERLCLAHFTPVSVMDLLGIYPREFQMQKLDSQGHSQGHSQGRSEEV